MSTQHIALTHRAPIVSALSIPNATTCVGQATFRFEWGCLAAIAQACTDYMRYKSPLRIKIATQLCCTEEVYIACSAMRTLKSLTSKPGARHSRAPEVSRMAGDCFLDSAGHQSKLYILSCEDACSYSNAEHC